MVRYCSDCEYTDNLIYTSMPPQVKCNITGEFHYLSGKCNVEFEPVKHGHWEDCSNGWMCSVCNRDSSKDTEYCPHCGAKMEDTPTVDTEPVIHAHWKKVGGYVTPGGDPVWACSNCGKGMHVWGVEASTYNRDISDEHQWVACPNCGAKMDEVVE